MNKISKSVTNGYNRMVNNRRFLYWTRQYAKLLQRGEVEFLVKRGKFRFVIAHPELIPVGAKQLKNVDAYAPYMAHISETMLHLYLKLNPKRFDLFLLHPLGLKVLAKEGFSGVIANREKEFVAIGRHFPKSFRISPQAYHDYIELLNLQLELSLPYAEADASENWKSKEKDLPNNFP